MDHQGNDHDGIPSVSRIGRPGARPSRVLSRAQGRYRSREPFPRQRAQRPIAELLGTLIQRHGLTDEMRQRVVCLYWPEIAGDRFASKTSPLSFTEGVLHVAATSSSWVHEMQFHKAQLIARIHDWIDANRVWLGPPPLVTDLRFMLGTQRRDRLVDPEHAQRLRLRQLQRMRRAREHAPPVATDADRDAIRDETSCIDDPGLRAVVEALRVKWNR